MIGRNIRAAVLSAAAIVAVIVVTARDSRCGTISTWNGSDGDWNNAAKWSTNPFFPNNGNGAASYDAVIGAGAVNLNTDVTIASLTLNGGTLSGSGNVVTDKLRLNGGTLSTTGSLSAATAVLDFGTLGRNLTLSGSTNTIQNLEVAIGATLSNPSGATLTATTGPGERETFGSGSFINQGTFIKNGNERFYASLPMNNDGVVQVQQGNLRLNSIGTHTGTFDVAVGAQLELAGNQTFNPSANISGLGGLLILSGTATINSDVSTGYIRLANGTLTGSGNLHPGHYSLDGGTIGRNLTLPASADNTIQNVGIGSGFTLTNPVGATLTGTAGPGEREANGPGVFINQGTFVKNGTDRFYLSMPMNNEGDVQVQQNNLRLNSTGTHTGTFEVSSGAQLELAGTQTFQPTATVSGAGGLLVTSGTATINSDVSTDYIRLSDGTLTGSGNLHPGHYSLDGGTIGRNLTLPASADNTIQNVAIGSGFTLTNPVGGTLTTITGPGEREANGPGLFINQGTFVKAGNARFYASMPMNNEGDVQVQQNSLRLNSTGTHTGTFEVSSGAQLELAGTQTFEPTATITGAGGLRILAGTATINSAVSTDYLWLSSGSGTLAGNGSLNPGHFTLEGGTLGRDLTINASPLNAITSMAIANGFTLTNPIGGQLGTTIGTVNGPGSFVNQGTITKTGSGTETFATFSNKPSGAVSIQAGTLRLSGIDTQEGTFTVSNLATLAFGGQPTSNSTLTMGTLITGAGSVSVAQGTLNVPGGSSNDYAGGTTVGSGGRVNIMGSGTGLSPATATIQSGGVVSIGSTTNLLSSQALVQLGGTLAVRNEFIPQAQIAAASAGTFGIDVLGFASTVDMSLLGNGSMSLGSSTTGTYTSNTIGAGAGNAYRLGGGGGIITLTQANVLTGDRPLTIVGPGTVVLPQPQNFTQGTTIQTGTVAVGNTGSLGSGPVSIQGGGLQASGGPITLNNDTTFAGNFTLGGVFDLTLAGASQLTGNRTLTVSNTATTTIAGDITQDVAGRSLTKDGPGSLVLSGNNSFTGGFAVRGGTVTLASEQHYGGTTTVDVGSKLVLQADLLGGGNVTVRGGGTLMGEGIVAGTTTIANTGILSPGHSPGVLNFSNGLALQNGSHYSWELSALSTANPGSNWDQIVVSGGPLSILSGAILDPKFIGSALAPNTGDPFWHSPHVWNNVINLTNTATNPTGFVNFMINNSAWSQSGFFSAESAHSGLGVDLVWNPVPEPAAWALLFLGAPALWIVGRFSRNHRPAV
jgi:fibronectin-binding autotransporter adhesin